MTRANSIPCHGSRLCDRLTSSEVCLVVEQYEAGTIRRQFHEHVPRHRLSEERLVHLLTALVFHFSGATPRTILTSSLNSRGKSPRATPLACYIDYPEPGVLRRYFGTDTIAWSDHVIAEDKFRKS